MPVHRKYKNKQVAIYGMGKTGLSAAKILRETKAKIFCWDDNIKIRRKIANKKYPFNKFWLKKNFN